MRYTSRSAVESYLQCPRKRYLNYEKDEVGIIPVAPNIDLDMGDRVHKGVGGMLQRMRDKVDVTREIARVCSIYAADKMGEGEDRALVEALVWAWWWREYPRLKERFDVLAVEQDVEVEVTEWLRMPVRVDALLREKDSGDIYNYQLKTAKEWTPRTEQTYRWDLQTLTEMVGTEVLLKEHNDRIVALGDAAERASSDVFSSIEKMEKFLTTVHAKRWQGKVTGTKFCFLLKGGKEREEFEAENGEVQVRYVRASPFVRGWTKGVEIYAHSDKVVKEENKSGYGKLGRLWTRFNVWEEMGVEAWMERLAEGEIQPELGDVIKSQIVTPVESMRREDEIKTAMIQIEGIENRVDGGCLGLIVEDMVEINFKDSLDLLFPHNRRSCLWPTECEYHPVCWGREANGRPVNPLVQVDPVGSGRYKWRVSHHQKEEEGGLKEKREKAERGGNDKIT